MNFTNAVAVLLTIVGLCSWHNPAQAAPLQYSAIILPANTVGNGIDAAGNVVGYISTGQSSTAAFHYTNGNFVTLPNTYQRGHAFGLNDAGLIVGENRTSSETKAFAYQNGSYQSLPLLNNRNNSAYAVNNAGAITGTTQVDPFSQKYQAFVYQNNQLTLLGGTEGFPSTGYAINNLGTVAGLFYNNPMEPSTSRPFIYKNGVMQAIPTPGNAGGIARGINDLDQVVGTSGNIVGTAFLYSSNGVFQSLGTLGGQGSEAHDINNLGQIVGRSFNANNRERAVLFENNQVMDLNFLLQDPLPELTLEYAFGINDAGQIVGMARHTNGTAYGYLLTPVAIPEPGTIAGVSLTLLGFVVLRYRKRSPREQLS